MEASSEPIAGDRVADRQREEAEPHGQHDDVEHLDAPSDEQLGVRNRWLAARHDLDLRQEPQDSALR
jgi:hypothetical protein